MCQAGGLDCSEFAEQLGAATRVEVALGVHGVFPTAYGYSMDGWMDGW